VGPRRQRDLDRGRRVPGRIFQHELDHLDGILLLERLDADTRKAALRTLRERQLTVAALDGEAEIAPRRGLRLPGRS
jgi:peptide deformylase